jgi:hypothetical protein
MASMFSYVTTESDSLQNCRYKHIMHTFLYVLQRQITENYLTIAVDESYDLT